MGVANLRVLGIRDGGFEGVGDLGWQVLGCWGKEGEIVRWGVGRRHEECKAIWMLVWRVRRCCGGGCQKLVWGVERCCRGGYLVLGGKYNDVLSPLVLFHVKRIGRGRYWE